MSAQVSRPAGTDSGDSYTSDSAIFVDSISKRYGRTLALDQVSLSVRNRDMFALLGPNGAGKTTLLHILCTILRPDLGTATLAGVNVARQPTLARQNIGVVFQEPSLDDRLTVEENLSFHGMVYGMKMRARSRNIEELLELVELGDWRYHLTRQLSSGMKRRLEIARALLHDPRILFLDEPTVGLDAQSRERIWSYIGELRKRRELTIVVTTHYIEEVEYCDQVCIIDNGKVRAEGTPDELKARHGKEVLHVVPRSPKAGAAIRARYRTAREAPDGELVIEVPGPGFADPFLAEFGTSVTRLAFERPNLESVFLALTGRELRDKAAGERERSYASGRRRGEPAR